MKPINVCKGGTFHSITWHEGIVVGVGGGFEGIALPFLQLLC